MCELIVNECIISMVVIKVLDDTPELGFVPAFLSVLLLR